MIIINASSEATDNRTLIDMLLGNVSNNKLVPCPVEDYSNRTLVQTIDFIITGPLMMSTIIIGLMTNIFCLIVFARRFRAVRIYFYLLVLAAWDCALEIGAFFMFALPTVLYGDIVLYGEYAPAFPFFYFLSNVARNGSVWIVVMVAFERYFALCYPYKFQIWNTERRVYTLLIVVSCLAFFYGVPRFFELGSAECKHPVSNLIMPLVTATDLRKNRLYWLIYRVAGGFIFYSVGPFILLTFLTIRISLEIGRNAKIMKPSPRKTARRDSQFVR